jgi:hypothetical protein
VELREIGIVGTIKKQRQMNTALSNIGSAFSEFSKNLVKSLRILKAWEKKSYWQLNNQLFS